MEAITYQALGDVQNKQIADPVASAGEVVVRVRASGICHTDIDILHGRYGNSTFPIVPGHEYAGDIVALGHEVSDLSIGQRVVIDPNFHCGVCRSCQRGLTNLCDSLGAYGVTRHGGFAQFSVVQQENVLPIGDLSYEVAAIAEPVGCVLNGLAAVESSGIANALIFGAGPIGILMALALRARGISDIAMVDIDESRLELAQTFELTPVASGSDELLAMHRSVDLVIDATGVPEVAQYLIDYTANGGNVLCFGVCPPGVTITLSPHEIFRRQIRIAGAHSLNHNIPEALKTIKTIGPCIERLISHRVPLSDIAAFLVKSGPGNTLKVQAVMSGD